MKDNFNKDNFNLSKKEKPTGKFKDLKKPKFFKLLDREVQSNLDVFFNTLKALKISKEQNDYINDLCSEYLKNEKKGVDKFLKLSPDDILRFLVYSQMNQADLDYFEFAADKGYIVKNPLVNSEEEKPQEKRTLN